MNGVLFLFAPFGSPREEESVPAASVGLGGLLKNKTVWLLMLFMLCAGASEQAVSQWSSTFAEQGLGVDKTLGDLIGVCGFALMMGISRMLYSLVSRKADVGAAINVSAALCVISYLGITLVPVPAVNLACCCLCGLSVGVLWPGVFSIAARTCRNGGTALFALLALAGDVGLLRRTRRRRRCDRSRRRAEMGHTRRRDFPRAAPRDLRALLPPPQNPVRPRQINYIK